MNIVKFIKNLFFILFFIILLIFMANFVGKNNIPVQLNLLDYTFHAIPVSALFIFFFLAGGVLGLTSGFFTVIKLRLQNKTLIRDLKKHKEELKKLREHTFKGFS